MKLHHRLFILNDPSSLMRDFFLQRLDDRSNRDLYIEIQILKEKKDLSTYGCAGRPCGEHCKTAGFFLGFHSYSLDLMCILGESHA